MARQSGQIQAVTPPPIRIPVVDESPEPICVKTPKAAELLGISRKTLWVRVSTGKIRQTIDGTYAVEELKRYAEENTK